MRRKGGGATPPITEKALIIPDYNVQGYINLGKPNDSSELKRSSGKVTDLNNCLAIWSLSDIFTGDNNGYVVSEKIYFCLYTV